MPDWLNIFDRKKTSGPRLVYVTDGSGWVLDWIGKYIADVLDGREGLRVELTHEKSEVDEAENALIHFGARYMMLKYPEWDLAKTNNVMMTWYHGDLSDDSPEMQKNFENLRTALPRIHQITTSCSTSKENLIRAGVPDEKIVLIPIGVDVSQFKPVTGASRKSARRELGIDKDAVCVGSFQKDGQGWGEGMDPKLIKGPDTFVEAMELLHKRVDKLVVVLTGFSRGYVKSQLEKRGISYVHRELEDYTQIGKMYDALDLYLIASRCEGGPVALMESWATGIPVVSTRMGMPADYIRDGENGLLREVEDAAGLAEACQELLENSSLRHACTQAGLEDVKSLDWKVLAELYWEKMYRPALEKMGYLEMSS